MRLSPILCSCVILMALLVGCGRDETAWVRPAVDPPGTLWGRTAKPLGVVAELKRTHDLLRSSQHGSFDASRGSLADPETEQTGESILARITTNFDDWNAARAEDSAEPPYPPEGKDGLVVDTALVIPAAVDQPSTATPVEPVAQMSATEQLNRRIRIAVLQSRLATASDTDAQALHRKIDTLKAELGNPDVGRSFAQTAAGTVASSDAGSKPHVEHVLDGSANKVVESGLESIGVPIGPASEHFHLRIGSDSSPNHVTTGRVSDEAQAKAANAAGIAIERAIAQLSALQRPTRAQRR